MLFDRSLHIEQDALQKVAFSKRKGHIGGPMIMTSDDYRHVLKKEYEIRTQRSPNYSLRSFARDLHLSSGQLSEILNYKHGLSLSRAKKICLRLGYSEKESEYFCTLVESSDARSQEARKKSIEKLKSLLDSYEFKTENPVDHFSHITQDSYKIIADWYHFAILELTGVKNFKSNPQFIAKRLGISKTEAELAIDRLLKVGLLEKKKNGELVPGKSHTSVPGGTPSEAIKTHHDQIIEKAFHSVRLQGIQDRDLSTMILAFDSRRMNEAREKIKKFRREFSSDMEKYNKKDKVYCLAVQFFSLEKEI